MDMADAEPDAADPMENMEAEPEGDYIGDMGIAEFQAMLAETLAPLIKALDISSKMDSQIGELKSMLGGVATKDAGTVAEIASLKARLAQIEGDQPATILPDEVAAALKSQPEQAKEPEREKIESTPERPWRGWAAATFPELYKQNGEPT